MRRRLGHGLQSSLRSAGYDRDSSSLRILANAVSAGEVAAISGLVHELKRQMPDAQIVLLTTTDSGMETAQKKLGGELTALLFFPLLDLWFASRHYLAQLRPDVYITTESELWPNIQAQCRRRGIPACLVNARLYLHNKRGLRGWAVRKLYQMLDLIDCQDFRQAAYFHKFGVGHSDRPQLAVSGNTKYDVKIEPWDEGRLLAWRERLGLGAPDSPKVLVAGSTHPGEDEIVLAALREARQHPRLSSTKLIIAPRHIERSSDIIALGEEAGLRCRLYSHMDQAGADLTQTEWDLLVVDAYGLLNDIYRVASLALIGGTFNPKVGGHNILELTALGIPAVCGPVTFGIRGQLELLRGGDALVEVSSAADIAGAMRRLLVDTREAQAIGERGRALTEANQGAAARAVTRIVALAEYGRVARSKSRTLGSAV